MWPNAQFFLLKKSLMKNFIFCLVLIILGFYLIFWFNIQTYLKAETATGRCS